MRARRRELGWASSKGTRSMETTSATSGREWGLLDADPINQTGHRQDLRRIYYSLHLYLPFPTHISLASTLHIRVLFYFLLYISEA